MLADQLAVGQAAAHRLPNIGGTTSGRYRSRGVGAERWPNARSGQRSDRRRQRPDRLPRERLQLRSERPSAPALARPRRPPGGRRPDAGLPRLIRRLPGRSRGRFRTGQGQHPPCPAVCPTLSPQGVSRNPMASLRFARKLPNRTLRFWAESGAGSDPPPIYGSTAPKPGACNAVCLTVRGRSQPAPGARLIPAGRLPAPPPAAGPSGGRQSRRRRRGTLWGPGSREHCKKPHARRITVVEAEPANLILVGCVKRKRSQPCPARDFYDESPLWRGRRAYAESSGAPWYILSAISSDSGAVDREINVGSLAAPLYAQKRREKFGSVRANRRIVMGLRATRRARSMSGSPSGRGGCLELIRERPRGWPPEDEVLARVGPVSRLVRDFRTPAIPARMTPGSSGKARGGR